MKSWRTTVTSAISAASAFVLFAQQLHYITFPNWAMAIAMFTMAGGLASFGVSAKDSQVSGGTISQPSSPEVIANSTQSPVVTVTTPTAPAPPEKP
jgi:hypothetical protein